MLSILSAYEELSMVQIQNNLICGGVDIRRGYKGHSLVTTYVQKGLPAKDQRILKALLDAVT